MGGICYITCPFFFDRMVKRTLTVIFLLLGCRQSFAADPDSLLVQAKKLLDTDLMKAEEPAQMAVDLFEGRGDKKGLSDAYFLLGYIHDEQNYLANAAIYYLEAVSLEETDAYTRLSCLKNLGRIFKVYKRTEEAEAYYLKALELARDYSAEEAAGILYNLGNLYKSTMSFDKAQISYLEAYEIYEDSKNYDWLANTTNQIGLVFKELKEYHTAREYYFRMINAEAQLKENYPKFAGRAWHNVAATHLEEGNLDEAIDGYMTAFQFKEKTGKDQFITLLDLGDAYSRAGDRPNALEAWSRALELIPMGEPDPEYFVLYKHLAKHHIDDFALYKSYIDMYTAHWEKYHAFTEQLADIDESYRFHITLEQYWQNQNQHSLRMQYLLVIAALAIMLGLLGFAVYSYRLRLKARRRLEAARGVLSS